MKYLTYLGFGILLVAVWYGVRITYSYIFNGEKIVDHSHHDDYFFGEVKPGEQVSHTFVIRNTLDRSIRILDVNQDCSCVSFDLKNRVVKAGGSEEIRMNIDTTGRDGGISKTIFVMTDGEPESVFTFSMRGNVTFTWVPDKAYLAFEYDLNQGISLEKEFEIFAAGVDARGVTFEPVVEDVPEFLSFESIMVDEYTTRIVAILDTEVVPDTFSAAIEFAPNMENLPNFEAVISGAALRVLYTIPSRAVFGVVTTGNTYLRKLRLYSEKVQSLSVVDFEDAITTIGSVSVVLEEQSLDKGYIVILVRLVLPKDEPMSDSKYLGRIILSHTRLGEVEIPILYFHVDEELHAVVR